MSVIQYDPDNWLVSATRSLGSYVEDRLANPDVSVEMSYPDTTRWTKESPLEKTVVHFEQDSNPSPPIGLGIVGVPVYNAVAGTEEFQEAMQHFLNFDVGVWASAQSGGGTQRMEIAQALHNIFGPAKARQDLATTTDGLVVVAFNGGRFVLDRINDLPVWRAMDMTLELHVFSRHIPATPDVAIDSFDQGEHLSVITEGGTTQPVETP